MSWQKTKKLRIERMPGNFEKRVFVGGNYDFMAKLRKIEKIIRKTGFIPILAYDFEVPKERIHDYDLTLLHLCKYAIFEETQPAGELMEIERARDYGTVVFVVYEIRGKTDRNPPSHLTSMVKSLSIPMFGYTTFEELERFITKIFPSIERNPLASWVEILRIAWLPSEIKRPVLDYLEELLKETQSVKKKLDIHELLQPLLQSIGIDLIELEITKIVVNTEHEETVVPIRKIDEISPGSALLIRGKFKHKKREMTYVALYEIDQNMNLAEISYDIDEIGLLPGETDFSDLLKMLTSEYITPFFKLSTEILKTAILPQD